MIEKRLNSLPLWFFENLSEQREICHFVSARSGGFSHPPYESLNLGFHVGDNPETVFRNRERLATALRIPMNSFTTARQDHGSNVEIITEALRGFGAVNYESAIYGADAMVTDIPGICLMVLQADCVPLLFFDVKKKVIGVAHAGWRGTVAGIAQKMIKTLKENFNCLPDDVLVGIGPSIGPCCYEVDWKVAVQLEESSGHKKDYVSETPDGKRYCDLWEANKTQLVQAGIPEKNIEIAGKCTYCNHTHFFSYRYQQRETGRFGAGILLINS